MTDITEMSVPQVIRKYFLPDMPVSKVMEELKKLSAEDKLELATGAAKELGVSLKAS